MKKAFTKPIARFIPLVEGIEASSLVGMSDEELARVVRLCKEAQQKKETSDIHHTTKM